MRSTRLFAPGAALLGLTIILAACAQAPAAPVSPTPSPTVAPSPSDQPSPSVAPTPTQQPSPDPIEVVEFELPMIARSTADEVEVHTLPSADAPLLIGEAFPDMDRVEIRLAADELVAVSLGPVFFDGTSWYQVSAVDGGDRAFAYGWVSAEFLVRESDTPDGSAQVVTVHGLGTGTDVSAPVPAGTPVTVDFAAAPMPASDSCELDVTLIRTDGLGVNVATQTVTEPVAFQFGASIDYGGLQSLFQEEAGDVTLQVETDCSYAASLTQPPF
jgi:hypothetical protein